MLISKTNKKSYPTTMVVYIN